MTSIIVDIDFDFFVREPSILDWGHQEGERQALFSGYIWLLRVQSAIVSGRDLGAILTPPNDATPWDFDEALEGKGVLKDFSPHVVADSHEDTGKRILSWVRDHPDESFHILHFDAHHDLGYGDSVFAAQSGMIDCGNWLRFVALEPNVARVDCIYPNWRKEPCPITGHDMAEYVKPSTMPENCHLTHFEDWEGFDPEAPEEAVLTAVCLSSAWVPPWLDRHMVPLFNGYEWEAIGHIASEDGGVMLRDLGDSWEEAKKRVDPDGTYATQYKETTNGMLMGAVPASQLHCVTEEPKP